MFTNWKTNLNIFKKYSPLQKCLPISKIVPNLKMGKWIGKNGRKKEIKNTERKNTLMFMSSKNKKRWKW